MPEELTVELFSLNPWWVCQGDKPGSCCLVPVSASPAQSQKPAERHLCAGRGGGSCGAGAPPQRDAGRDLVWFLPRDRPVERGGVVPARALRAVPAVRRGADRDPCPSPGPSLRRARAAHARSSLSRAAGWPGLAARGPCQPWPSSANRLCQGRRPLCRFVSPSRRPRTWRIWRRTTRGHRRGQRGTQPGSSVLAGAAPARRSRAAGTGRLGSSGLARCSRGSGARQLARAEGLTQPRHGGCRLSQNPLWGTVLAPALSRF